MSYCDSLTDDIIARADEAFDGQLVPVLDTLLAENKVLDGIAADIGTTLETANT